MPKTKKLNPTQKIAIAVNVVIRTVTPLWVFINPWQGAIIALVTDCIDYQPLVNVFKINRLTYELQDKYLDLYWYILIFIYGLTTKLPSIVTIIIAFTFLIRLVGQMTFSHTHDERVLFVFPNLVESFFWLWLILPSAYNTTTTIIIFSVIIIIFKLVQEYIVHHLQYSPIDHIRAIILNNNHSRTRLH